MEQQEMQTTFARLKAEALNASTESEARAIISRIATITRQYRIAHNIGIPPRPDLQAMDIDPLYVSRPHLDHVSGRIAQAVRDVERGQNRRVAVSMPPRAGKSTLLSLYSPLWMLRRHPEWKIVMASHDGGLTADWARAQRTIIEQRPELGVALKPDGGAGARWSTVENGGMYATSTKGSLTGRGARVMIIDDPVKDFVDAHSINIRENLWNWWLSVAQTRLESPYLVLVVMTRWHEDDFVGRIFSDDYEGLSQDWERIVLPAFAEDDDVLGREPGQPLLSPLVDEDDEQATERWESVKRSVGTYTFAAMYQQRPAPAKGAIFDANWWRFWTTRPEKATDDGRVVYLDPISDLSSGQWVDSWDCSFKGGVHSASDYVVGQRWVRTQANRYLVHQVRRRMTFTQTLAQMEQWAEPDNPVVSPGGHLVHVRLIEDAANGPAIIDTMRDRIAGLKPIRPRSSKEARARAITPEVESGNVYLPHPGDPGNEWVTDLLSELRNFPNDAHDDQVDTLTQALTHLRGPGKGIATVPGSRTTAPVRTSLRQVAASDRLRRRGY